MKTRTFTTAIVYSLLVIFSLSLFPVDTGVRASGLQGSGAAAKRKKNGEESASKKPAPAESVPSTKASQTDPAEEKKTAEQDPVNPPAEDANARPQNKKEPLPFDRPPLSDTRNNTETREKSQPSFDRPASTSTAPSVPPQRPGVSVQRQDSPAPSTRSSPPSSQPSTQPARSSQPQEEWDRDANSGTRNTPPVLRREPDSRNTSSGETRSDSRGAPPVLTRPTDPTRTNPSNFSI